jgi:hypothetical protein
VWGRRFGGDRESKLWRGLTSGLVVGEEIPGLAALIDDVAAVIINGDGELVSQVFPDVFHRIEKLSSDGEVEHHRRWKQPTE